MNIVKKQIIFNSYYSIFSDLNNNKLCNYRTERLLTSNRYISSSKNNIIPNENKPFIFEAVKNSQGPGLIQNLGNPYVDYHLKWKRSPRTVLIVKKPKDNTTEEALISIAKYNFI